ncbi:MAG: diguanylate cyclase [Planctomycetes bacterium]|nr:diguanylate cyclase [Planctomycetota bacterium]MCB9935393.1 diguanylate cyclase [Planctomycetota bacterium]
MRERIANITLALFAVAAVGWLDFSTTNQYRSVLFYLLPVVFVAWFAGTWATVFISMACAMAYAMADANHVADLNGFSLVWHDATTFTLLLFVGLIIVALRRQRDDSLHAAARIRVLLERESQASHTDALTELPNLREFRERLEPEIARCRRLRKPLCLMYLDLDNFKLVNDLYGHSAGDDVLTRVAVILRRYLRGGDVPARLGGDEFAALLWQTDPREARAIAQRILDAVHDLGERYPGSSLSASAGVVWYDTPPQDAREVVRSADDTMYRAKRTGKSRIVMVKPTDTLRQPVKSA